MSDSINPHYTHKKLELLAVDEYVQGILNSDRVILSRAITLIESSRPDHQKIARQVISACLPHTGKSLRVGITGVPGVGKSTFIEASGLELLNKYNKKLAILAIDPSSTKQRGSILGDKTRMDKLAVDSRVFIRPSPTGGSLGGVARKTQESVLLCEAAGYDLILIETVGVGQSEITVHDMVDCFLLLMLSGAGDQLQGIKRGIMEMADIIAITKADSDNLLPANAAKSEYELSIKMLPVSSHGILRTVFTTSALTGFGITDVWKSVFDFAGKIKTNGFLDENRQNQSSKWMKQELESALLQNLYTNHQVKKRYKELEVEIKKKSKNPFDAAHELLDTYLKDNKE